MGRFPFGFVAGHVYYDPNYLFSGPRTESDGTIGSAASQRPRVGRREGLGLPGHPWTPISGRRKIA